MGSVRDIFTHSFHQERFIELMLRGAEDNCEEIKHVKLRVINDQNYYEKHGYLAVKVSHFKRLMRSIADNKLQSLHVDFSKLSIQDNRAVEEAFETLSETIENQQRSLKELAFHEVQFDLNSNSEKDFYNALSFPNLHTLSLVNCKFLCYDSFERFFSNLSDTENTIRKLEIRRLNSSVTATGFREFLLSQEGSLQTLILSGVHKNILNKKYLKKVMPVIAARLTNLRHLSLEKNQIDFERIETLSSAMVSGLSFQELITLDLGYNSLENNSILVLYKILKERHFSLETLNLSGNAINEEGLNLLLTGKTEQGSHPLTRGLLANDMKTMNFLVNNSKTGQLETLEVAKSFSSVQDPSVGFSMAGLMSDRLLHLNLSHNKLSME
jgi:hypothetical protein